MRTWVGSNTRRAGAVLVLAWLFGAGAQAAVITPELAAELAARAPQDEIAVIVSIAGKVDPGLYEQADRSTRDTRLVQALRARAAASQGTHRTFLQNQRAHNLRELWAINGLAVTARVSVIRTLASRPGIERISLDSTLNAPATRSGSSAPPAWNINVMRAPALWSLGHTGTGIVVANMDTGVDAAHPDLAARWRGGSNSWYDPHGQHATPYDRTGHGTQTMAIMVGGTAGGPAIGMAPGARWIATKLFNDAGQARYSDIHLAFQWLLDPDGDPATVDSPDVVNASWGLAGTAGQCITEFSSDIAVLKAAGIAIAFAAGNDGPAPLTSVSPANNPVGFSAGAVDAALAVAGFSSRGQSACDGSVYPKLVAPGVNIKTADLSFGGMPLYIVVSGTSYAAPHAAGALALLAGAFPGASVAQLEAALTRSARDLGVAGEDNSYGHGLADVQAAYEWLLAGTGSPPSITSTPPTSATEGVLYRYLVTATDPDGDALGFSLNVAPAGMTIDASTGAIAWTPAGTQVGAHPVTVQVADAGGQAASQSFSVTVANLIQAPLAANDAYSTAEDATLSVAIPGVLGNDDAGTTASRLSGPSHGTLSLLADGSFTYTPALNYSGADSFSYRALSGGEPSLPATVSLTVTAVNDAPLAASDTYTVAAGSTLTVGAPGVLGNDSDVEAQSLTAVNASALAGRSALAANGSFTYTAPITGGNHSFTYQASDGTSTSTLATVTISVTPNSPPVAVNDTFSAPRRTSRPYTPVLLNVVANDTDPNGNLDPTGVSIVAQPNKGGTVSVNAINGTVSYSPKPNFRGTENFTYRVRDSANALSNIATVMVDVQ